jgi:threonine dehydratase
MIDDYLQRILKARVYDVAIETPLDAAPRLSTRLGNEVLFKREDLQPVYSFKIRGAYNKLMRLPAEEREKGVICASAGNHAQGMALAAGQLGLRAVVVMPVFTPSIKVEAVRAYGGEVVLFGDSFDDAYAEARRRAADENLCFAHPFDDPDVIAGQGTIGMEILRQHPGVPDAIFVPVGGGGLIAGIALYTKALFPSVRIIGVEPSDAASMHAALQAGEPVTLEHVGRFADGVAVKRVGDETFRLCRELVDEIVLVNTDQTCAAIRDIFEDTRAIVEPAGALAVAGMKKFIEEQGWLGRTCVTLNCGANINFDRLQHIAERTKLGEQREALLAVEIPERPGSFHAFCRAIGERDITEFNYRYADAERAEVFVGVELSGGRVEGRQLAQGLRAAGYAVADLSDNELAKLHVRHMVGGTAPQLADEVALRFEFPERRGALLKFLTDIGSRWSFSLFHYRNHGSDYARVLAGLLVPAEDRDEFFAHLETLRYPFRDETGNPAYRRFLGGETGADTLN